MTTENPDLPENEKPVFSAKGRMTLARIRDMIQDDVTGRAMLRAMRGQLTDRDIKKYPNLTNFHVKISNAEFWKVHKLATSYQESARKIKFGRNDRTIPESSYNMTPFNMTRGRYQHIVRIKGFNQAKEAVEKHVTVSSSKRLSKNEIYAGVEKIIENDQNAYDFMESRGLTFALVEFYQTT